MSIPVVFTREEVAAVLEKFKCGSQQKLIAHLLYGCGLRLEEVLGRRSATDAPPQSGAEWDLAPAVLTTYSH